MKSDFERGWNLEVYTIMWNLEVYTIMCEKCRWIYYFPVENTEFYKYCPHCKTKVKDHRK